MKVKFATQVLSHTVSAAVLKAVGSDLLPQSAVGTAELILQFEFLITLTAPTIDQ